MFGYKQTANVLLGRGVQTRSATKKAEAEANPLPAQLQPEPEAGPAPKETLPQNLLIKMAVLTLITTAMTEMHPIWLQQITAPPMVKTPLL